MSSTEASSRPWELQLRTLHTEWRQQLRTLHTEWRQQRRVAIELKHF